MALLLAISLLCGPGCSKKSVDLDGVGQFLPTAGGLNVLVVSFDALRADSLGVYGYGRNTSPHLDRLAPQGVVFTQAHSTSQATPTSFAAAFTGNLPFRSFLGWKMVKGPTLAGMFQEAGYRTAFITDNAQLVAERNFGQGFAQVEVLTDGIDSEMLPKTITWLEENHRQRFFAWFHFLSPHTPYTYRELAAQFYDPQYHGRFEKSVAAKYQLKENFELKRVRDLYDGQIFYADQIFQEIWDKLSTLGLSDNTVVVFTSDHGEEFLEHGGTEHDNLFEEVNRIPLIIWHPQALKKGLTPIPYLNVDLFPTLAGLLKLPTPKNLDGVDLRAMPPPARVGVAVAMTKSEKIELSGRRGEYKVLQTCVPEKKAWLYNLRTDPAELNPSDGNNATVKAEILQGMAQVTKGEPCAVVQQAMQGKTPEQGLSPQQIKQLRNLGYVK